jgi:putative nucleotidyltransferase with HDIG domain
MASLPTASKPTRNKGKSRRGVKKSSETLADRFARFARHPSAGWGLITAAVFAIAMACVVGWAREQAQLVPARTARETRVVRVEFDALNAQQSAQQRENARQNTPRVYRLVDSTLDAVVGDIQRLPAAVAIAQTEPEAPSDAAPETDAPGPDAAARAFVASLNLTPEQRTALASIGAVAESRTAWAATTGVFRDILERNPLLNRADWNRAVSEGLSRNLELITPSGSRIEQREQAINIDEAASFAGEVSTLIRVAGYPPEAADAVRTVILQRRAPTFAYDASLSDERQGDAVDRVQPVVDKRAVGQTIFTRGDVLTPAQVTLYEQELVEYRNRAPAPRLWSARLGVAAVVLIATAAMSFLLVSVVPVTIAKPRRIVRIAVLVAIAVLIASAWTIADPTFLPLSSTASVALLTVLMVTVFNRLAAALIGLFAALLVSLALTPTHNYLAINAAGIASVLWCLPEIRDRGSLVRMSLWLALAVSLATAADRVSALPMDASRIGEVVTVSVMAGTGGLIVGGVTLFMLPWVERVFNITTGMTLVELRDPKQPLLRELQQKAPGTYNHSLNVATIAESAAASIEADALLTYAGALYHDIGKMTKPEYFVENQSGGTNRHDRLSPAMSVLVIIGHVKDGLELAREYSLPRPLHHFIEAHHGTTLVEYFYHRAKKKAEDTDEDIQPEEFDFRYPGPKPRTKEAAILMLADSVESATRTLREPTPSRIESLVEQIASKRLMDGQFDQCDLTLGELHTVCESISKTLASIYHGRVQYPGEEKGEKPAKPADEPPQARDKSA